ncbi:MAG: DNRLRE domain-containing protein [Vicinamibacterales bacterium]
MRLSFRLALRARTSWLLALTLALTALLGRDMTASPPPGVLFGPGSLIIPMDNNFQNNGMLRAYGLVYALLRNGVPVSWAINSGKVAGGADISVDLDALVTDFRTDTTVLVPFAYRGGPFVIDASDAAAAKPIINAWQATAGDVTVVHSLDNGSIATQVARQLVGAPRIAVFKDTYEAVAFNNFNAAGIPDADGAPWSAASPDVLSEADIMGPSLGQNDGALHDAANDDQPRYCYLASEHYDASLTTTANLEEVSREIRFWLTSSSLSHLFGQCSAITAFDSPSAFPFPFLSSGGLQDDGAAPTTVANRVPGSPLTQVDGSFVADSGAVDSIGLFGGSSFRTGVQTLFNDSATANLTQRIVMLNGRLDGEATNGQVTYLAGHDYSTSLPVSTNPQTNGVRLFLNSLFASDCATTESADVTLTMSAPAFATGNTITYTISYANNGLRTVEHVRVTDTLPAGASYIAGSASLSPTVSGNTLTFDLSAIAPGGTGSITFAVNVPQDGTYANQAQISFSHIQVKTIASNAVTTVRDTVPPTVQLVPFPSYTNDATPTFAFSTSGALVTTCKMDGGAEATCTSPFASSTLVDGPHTFTVKATDGAGNSATASDSFVVDVTPPVVQVITPGTAAVYALNAVVTSSVGCSDGLSGIASCSYPPGVFTGTPGAKTFTASAFDLAGNAAMVVVPYTVVGLVDGKDIINFEDGSLTHVVTGVDKISGSVKLETGSPLKGTTSATINTSSSSAFLEENIPAVDDLYVSFYLRINALRSGQPRIAVLSNAGVSVGNLLLTSAGRLRLRNDVTQVGADSAALVAGKIYRVGMHQKKGTSGNAVLEAFLAEGDDAFGAPFASLAAGAWLTAADRIRLGATASAGVNLTIDNIRLGDGVMPSANPPQITAVADSLVKSSAPNKNEGTSTTLRTREGVPNDNYRSYLSFKVSGLLGSVDHYRLRVFANDANAAGLQVYATASGWTETGITFNTAPALGALLGSTGAFAKNSWVEIVLPGTFFSNLATESLVLVGRNTQSVLFSSKEGANKPQLIAVPQAVD